MNSKGSGGKLEGFFTGKGFYIVLFLCAAVIGVSAWMMAGENETMVEDVSSANSAKMDSQRVETVIVPPVQETVKTSPAPQEAQTDADAPAIDDSGLAEANAQPEEETSPVWNEDGAGESSPAVYLWPVTGELDREHSVEMLKYDVTMGDWRTHNGIDILAPLGTAVTAARGGSVESVVNDDLYGTVVVINHGDGARTVYANLAEETAVGVGDRVEAGTVIGTVGGTALCEVAQEPHLHFAVTVNGVGLDPMSCLPA